MESSSDVVFGFGWFEEFFESGLGVGILEVVLVDSSDVVVVLG